LFFSYYLKTIYAIIVPYFFPNKLYFIPKVGIKLTTYLKPTIMIGGGGLKAVRTGGWNTHSCKESLRLRILEPGASNPRLSLTVPFLYSIISTEITTRHRPTPTASIIPLRLTNLCPFLASTIGPTTSA